MRFGDGQGVEHALPRKLGFQPFELAARAGLREKMTPLHRDSEPQEHDQADADHGNHRDVQLVQLAALLSFAPLEGGVDARA